MSVPTDDGRHGAVPPDAPDGLRMGPVEGVVLALFWVLAAVVFLQFFTRYVLNDSIAWTEEIARYLLIGVGFIGSIVAVRKNSHIAVEFFYRYIPPGPARALSTVVDLSRVAFFLACAWIGAKLALKSQYQKMVSVELPKSVIYWMVAASFAAMTVYAAHLAWRHWRQGYSALTRRDIDRVMTD
jgi:TRAP-type C4-dicarboxylate transport system permease small subunit